MRSDPIRQNHVQLLIVGWIHTGVWVSPGETLQFRVAYNGLVRVLENEPLITATDRKWSICSHRLTLARSNLSPSLDAHSLMKFFIFIIYY